MKQKLSPRVTIFLAISLFGILVFLLWGLWAQRQLVNSLIVVPVGVIIWAIGLYLKSAPQVLYWVVFIFLFIVISVRVLGLLAPTPIPKVELDSSRPRRERVGFWLLQILLTRRGKSPARFGDLFGRLSLDILAQINRKTPIRMEHDLLLQPGDVPEPLIRYVHYRKNKANPVEKTFLERLAIFLGKRDNNYLSFSDNDIETILHYFEEQLEVKSHENR